MPCPLEQKIPRSVHVELNPSGASGYLSVTRLLSVPRHVADAPKEQWTMPDDAQERLWKSLQSCLRQTLLRLLTVLDTSELGTSKLLTVPMDHLHAVVPGSNVDGLACAEQWVSLAEASSGRRRTSHKRKSVVSGVLQYEPNLRLQALPTVVQRPFECVLLKCTECGQPLSSSWYFVHPRTGKAQVLTPSNGHYQCTRLHRRPCYFRDKDKQESILDVLQVLDLCEHTMKRSI